MIKFMVGFHGEMHFFSTLHEKNLPIRFVFFKSRCNVFALTRRSGGIGRRAAFRSQWEQSRGGSNPPPGTKFKYKIAPKCHKVSHFGAFLCLAPCSSLRF